MEELENVLLKLKTIHRYFLCSYKRQISMLRFMAMQGYIRTWHIYNTGKTLNIAIESVIRAVTTFGKQTRNHAK